MKLADKRCYPVNIQTVNDLVPSGLNVESHYGLTFRERLIIALAGNSALAIIQEDNRRNESYLTRYVKIYDTAQNIIQQADAIIKEMEE